MTWADVNLWTQGLSEVINPVRRDVWAQWITLERKETETNKWLCGHPTFVCFTSFFYLPRNHFKHTVQWKDSFWFLGNKFSIVKAGQSIWFALWEPGRKENVKFSLWKNNVHLAWREYSLLTFPISSTVNSYDWSTWKRAVLPPPDALQVGAGAHPVVLDRSLRQHHPNALVARFHLHHKCCWGSRTVSTGAKVNLSFRHWKAFCAESLCGNRTKVSDQFSLTIYKYLNCCNFSQLSGVGWVHFDLVCGDDAAWKSHFSVLTYSWFCSTWCAWIEWIFKSGEKVKMLSK